MSKSKKVNRYGEKDASIHVRCKKIVQKAHQKDQIFLEEQSTLGYKKAQR